MLNFKNDRKSNFIISDKIPLRNEFSKTPPEVLNALIKELRETPLDIRRVSFFEDPPEAIVHIKKPNRPRSKWAWLNAFGFSKTDKAPMLFLKLQVQQDLNPRTPCVLEYEIQPGLA